LSANIHFSSETQSFYQPNDNAKSPVLTSVLTRVKNRGSKKRFQRVANGIYRFKRTGILYAVFKADGRTRWKCLSTDDITLARQLLAEQIKNSSQIDWRQAGTLTVQKLIEMYRQNPMGLATSTLEIRKQLLNVFERTWKHGIPSMPCFSVETL
jgi:hypothetical protein